jgi:hypothetical protein
LYNVAVVPLHTPAIRRKRCERQPVGELKQCAPSASCVDFVDRVTALFQDGRQCVFDAPQTVTQMVLDPWFIETGGFTGAFQPTAPALAQPVEQ